MTKARLDLVPGSTSVSTTVTPLSVAEALRALEEAVAELNADTGRSDVTESLEFIASCERVLSERQTLAAYFHLACCDLIEAFGVQTLNEAITRAEEQGLTIPRIYGTSA